MKLFVVFALAFAGYACADVIAPFELPEEVAESLTPKAYPVHPKDVVIEENIEERITNGWRANEGQLPYQAGLGFSSPSGGWWCGGSVIGQHWIITAAHCTRGASNVNIYLGSTVRTHARWSVNVGSGNFRQHAAYNTNNLNNDISLIHTPAIAFSNFIKPIALPPNAWANDAFVNHYGTASGWGQTTAGGLPNDLQYTYLQIIGNDVCQRTYGGDVIRGITLCTATPSGQSTCSGDSGGPLVLYGYDKLVGVTSFVSSAGCTSGAPAGFVRVTAYLGWIRDHTGIQG